MDDFDAKTHADIAAYGCTVIHVMEEGDLPPFAYSIGITQSAGAPEVVIIGLPQRIAHPIVNTYNRRVREGERFVVGQRYAGFLEGLELAVCSVSKDHYVEYFGAARGFYGGSNFDVVQLVFPAKDGTWPWDAGATDAFRAWQPLLGATDSDTPR